LLSRDDLRRLPGWRAPGQWQPGDPAQLDFPLLQVLARRTAADFPRKPSREGLLRMTRPKAAPSRLDPLSTKVCGSRSCVVMAGGVNPVARCRILRCTT